MDDATANMMELKPTHHKYLLMEPKCSKEEEIRIIKSSKHLEPGTKAALLETISGMTEGNGFLQREKPTMWGVIGFRRLEVQLMESVAYQEDREAGSLSNMERLRQSEVSTLQQREIHEKFRLRSEVDHLEHNLNRCWMALQALLVRYANRKIGRELNQGDQKSSTNSNFAPILRTVRTTLRPIFFASDTFYGTTPPARHLFLKAPDSTQSVRW
jgi:hypothetical protein